MDTKPIPKAVREGTFDLCGVTMRVCVLDDGQRVIDAESVAELFSGDGEITPEQFEAFLYFLRML